MACEQSFLSLPLGGLPPVEGTRDFPGVFYYIGWWESGNKWVWPFQPFLNLTATLCKYWTSIKIIISMIVSTKSMKLRLKEQWLQLNCKYGGYTIKMFISRGWCKFLANGWSPCVDATFIHTLIHTHIPILSQYIQPIVSIQQRLQAYALL